MAAEMNRWWRAYDEAVDDPKLQLLPAPLFKTWFNLLCIASRNGGKLPASNVIAFKLRTTEAKINAALKDLIGRDLIDDIDGVLQPHNWDGRQFTSDVTDPTNAKRQKRFRERHRNEQKSVTDTVTITPPREEQIADTEKKERKKDAANAAPPHQTDEADLFRRGKQILGDSSGGMIAKLLKAKEKNVALARAAVEQASTKQNPREYIGAIIQGREKSTSGNDLWDPGL